MTRIYLDTCSLHRPLDDRSQARIALEAEAILAVLALCENNTLTLVSSDVIAFEVNQNPHPQRKIFVTGIIEQAQEVFTLTQEITDRAKGFEQQGIKAIDALHLATAEAANVDFFCTCDDRFYRRTKDVSSLAIRVVTPLELAQEVIK
jgi:predicted nucleic acid-binding protein